MKSHFRMGLRSRLSLLVCLAVAPALGLALYSGVQYRDSAAARARESALQSARLAAAAQERQFHGLEELLTVLASVPEVRGGDREACTTFLSLLLRQYPAYTVLAVTDLAGKVISSAVPTPKPVIVSDRAYFKKAIATRSFAVGGYQVSRITGKKAINCARPVFDATGNLRGVVFAGLDLDRMEQLGIEAGLPPGATLTIVDSDGIVLMRYPNSEQWVGKPAAHHPAFEAAARLQNGGTIEATGLDGVARIYGFASLTGPAKGVRVMVGVSSDRAFAEVAHIRTRDLILLALVALLVVTAAWLGGHVLVVRPVHALIAATRRLRSADLTVRAGLDHQEGELGELAQAFDEMAASIERDVAELERVQQTLRFDEARSQALLKFGEMTESSLQEITDFALEEAVRLTHSTIGYLAFLSEDETVLTMHSWSKTAMKQCSIIDKPIIYQVVNTGLWGEAVRQRQPVVTNDYTAPNPLKKSYPEGHVEVKRHMNVPVFDGARIVAVAGVGNKEAPYDDSDILQLRLLMDGMWRLLHRKQAAEALQRAHDELELRVAQRTCELARSNAELEQFAYVASHDLQEPLRKIQAFGDRLRAKLGDQLSPETNDYLERMQNAARRMSDLINDLLSYSRVTTKAQPFVPVSLDAIAAEVLSDLEVRIQEAVATVDVGHLPELQADPTQMRQLLQNLIANALKFHRPGTPPVVTVRGCLLDETRPGPASAAGSEPICQITVEDNGIGFEPRFADRIFVLFQRLHERGQYEGTGIGLALCRKIAERHGGSITAESQLGGGSTFTVTLPAAHQEGEAME